MDLVYHDRIYIRTDTREFGTRNAYHAQLPDFASPPEVEERQSHNSHLLI